MCDGHRSGQLCGDCEAGYTESVGSSACIHVSSCLVDRVLLWTAMVAGVFIAGFAVLVAADVFFPSTRASHGNFRMFSYFLQVRLHALPVMLL